MDETNVGQQDTMLQSLFTWIFYLFYPQLEEIEKLKERLKEAYVYYEVKTETYEKPKRTRKFYKNYILKKNKRSTRILVSKEEN